MKVQNWIFSVYYYTANRRTRRAIVGPARPSTVEAVLHLAGVPETVRAEIRAEATARLFVDGALDPKETGYYIAPITAFWCVCIGPVHEVIQ